MARTRAYTPREVGEKRYKTLPWDGEWQRVFGRPALNELRRGKDPYGVTGGASHALGLDSAQGGFVEMQFREPGTYTFVNHRFAEMERGAMGKIKVTDK